MKRRLEPAASCDPSLWRAATDFERRMLAAMAAERPSAAMRARMQQKLGLSAPPFAFLSERCWQSRAEKPDAPS